MSIGVASKIIEFAYRTTPSDEKLEIGFFGGEPLLEFEVVKEIVGLVETHPHFDRSRVHMTVITNGTFSISGKPNPKSPHRCCSTSTAADGWAAARAG